MQLRERGLTQRAPDPRTNTGIAMVGVCAFSGSLYGLELVPLHSVLSSRPPVPLKGHNAHRWALVRGLVKPTPLPFTKDE